MRINKYSRTNLLLTSVNFGCLPTTYYRRVILLFFSVVYLVLNPLNLNLVLNSNKDKLMTLLDNRHISFCLFILRFISMSLIYFISICFFTLNNLMSDKLYIMICTAITLHLLIFIRYFSIRIFNSKKNKIITYTKPFKEVEHYGGYEI